MQCFVYKGERKEDHYLFLPSEVDEVEKSNLPQALLDMLGRLSLVTEFSLTAERRLPQADAAQVLHDLSEKGFYLQMPKKDMSAIEAEWFN